LKEYFKNKSFIDYLQSKGGCCNQNCFNRNAKIECSDEICDCTRNYCNNRYNKKKSYDNLEIIKTNYKGYGIICKKEIKKGDFIIEYAGKIIEHAEMIEVMMDESLNDYYIMDLENYYYIDASKFGNKSRFINHSCNPNAIIEKWAGPPNFSSKIFIFAKENIKAGTEITYNYKFSYFKNSKRQECRCESVNCAKFIGYKSIENKFNLTKAKTFSYNFIVFDKRLLYNYYNHYPNVLNNKDDYFIQMNSIHRYENMKKSSSFLNRNLNLMKRNAIDNFFLNNKEYFLENNNFLQFFTPSFINLDKCIICLGKDNLIFCWSCGYPIHIKCSKNIKYNSKLSY
jgi:hypothetical protein